MILTIEMQMSSGSMINSENQESFSQLFHKFIRMTIQTDQQQQQQQRKFQKKHSISKSNHHFNSSYSKRQQERHLLNRLSPTSNRNPSSYVSIDNEQHNSFLNESKNVNATYSPPRNHTRVNMKNSFGDIGLSVTSKPLDKIQKLSVDRIVSGSSHRRNEKEDIGNVRSFHMFNNDNSFPFINHSILSEKSLTRLNQPIVSHHHYGAAALTARSFRREKSINESSRSFSKDVDQSIHNTSISSILSNSNHLFKSKSSFSNENLPKSLTFPIKPSEALLYYNDQLSELEKSEILDFDQIYFLGVQSRKIVRGNLSNYDDEHGCYKKVIGDHIYYRFEIFETLGKGSFGLVLKCFDHKNKEMIAIKIIRNKKRFQQQGLVEIQILKHLKNLDHDNSLNIVHIKEHFNFRSHLCITFELLGINLYQLIKKNNYQGFPTHLIKRFANSLLQSLRVLARENIIHCDLKPENILLREKGSSSIKVIDFGSGCFQSEKIYTYIQSRFYRSPEIILGIPYTSAIDMWSLACILVELFTGYPIFPGENEQEQLAMIIEVFDLPPNHVIEQGTRKELFFDSKGMPRSLSSSSCTLKKRRPGSRPLSEIVRTSDQLFLDFLRQCFQWNPCQRLTAEQGLHHPWIVERKFQRRLSKSSKKFSTKKYTNISNPTSIIDEKNQSMNNTFPRLFNQ